MVGFDTSPAELARPRSPPCASPTTPHHAKGVAAAEWLLDPAGHPASRVLPIELVVRASTAPPPRPRGGQRLSRR